MFHFTDADSAGTAGDYTAVVSLGDGHSVTLTSTAGTNGRCVEQGGGIAFCGCTYDTCVDDAACPTGQTCACHGSPYNGGGNSCVPGNCRVDTDCGPGGYCSPSGPRGVRKSYCLGYCKLIFAPPEKIVSCTVSTPPLDVPGGTSNDTTA